MSVHHHRASGWSFDIAPMLDRGWGYDPYVAHLIGKIRAGRPAPPCLFDANSLYLGSGQDTVLQRYAAKKREITDAEMAEYRADQEKRRLANEAIYAEERAAQRARVEAKRLEKERIEKEWREHHAAVIQRHLKQHQEWSDATPQPRLPHGNFPTIPVAGWWREQGEDVVVAIMLQNHNARDVLVGPEGAGIWLAKAQIKEVKNYLNGLHELRIDGALAKRLGFCRGEPTRWVS